MLTLNLKRFNYILKRFYLILHEKPSHEQLKEQENYGVDNIMTKTTRMVYMKDNLIHFIKNYKTTKEMFEAIKASYNFNTTTHVQVLL